MPSALRPQLEIDTPLVALAAARSVLDEAAVLVGRPLPARFAALLAHRAHRVYAHSDSFRRKLRARGDSGREWLHVFLRHWLAALLRDECPVLFARLPAAFANGRPCGLSATATRPRSPAPAPEPFLRNEARQLIA